eukprot:1621897-Rhodomonas_salina.9
MDCSPIKPESKLPTPICLRASYAKSGTDIACGKYQPTRVLCAARFVISFALSRAEACLSEEELRQRLYSKV